MQRNLRSIVYYLITSALAVFATNTNALTFGHAERIERLTEVKLKGPQGENLYLGYKISSESFLASYSLKEEGYVLGIQDEYKKYYPLPQAEVVLRLQTQNLLPSPFPTYRLSFMDYLFGYALWMSIPVILLWMWLERVWRKRKLRNGWIDPSIQKIQGFTSHYLKTPVLLPMTLKGRSLIRGSNDLVLTESGFAFSAISGLKDVIYWADVSGFGLGNFRKMKIASWYYSQEFRSLHEQTTPKYVGGLSQMARCDQFKIAPEEIIAMLNATWLQRRGMPIRQHSEVIDIEPTL